MTTVYVVTSGSYSDYRIERVYLDRDEAYRYVEARQKTRYSEVNDVEEYEVGAPPVEFAGPIWEGTFSQRRVINSYGGGFFGPGWKDLAAPRYTGGVEDSWDYSEVWHEGTTPPKAEVKSTSLNAYQDTICACVRGSSREHVAKVLQDTVARLKAEKAGIA